MPNDNNQKIKYYQFIILYITYLLNILYILVIRTFCDWLNYGKKVFSSIDY